MSTTQPLISVVTPVYNGGKFIAECIDSVLAQSWENFEYVIVNNCSTDDTAEVIRERSQGDPRVRVCETDRLLPLMDNWNHSLRQISPESRFCKVVHADDWLFPDCLALMAGVASGHRGIGIVGAYAQWGTEVACDGLPYPSTVLTGREIARLSLLGHSYPFLSPSCLLIRSDLIRRREPFYSGGHLHADVEVLYELLKECDFGFTHQVLTYVRRHDESETATQAKPLNTLLLQNLDLLVKFGPIFLDENEYRGKLNQVLDRYDQFLLRNRLKGRDADFWNYHREGLNKLGFSLSSSNLWVRWPLEKLMRFATKLSKKVDYISR